MELVILFSADTDSEKHKVQLLLLGELKTHKSNLYYVIVDLKS